jgi:hypothetical protein
MDRPKHIDDESVRPSLGTVVTINEPLMGPDPSVSTGTAKSVKFPCVALPGYQAFARMHKYRRFWYLYPFW